MQDQISNYWASNNRSQTNVLDAYNILAIRLKFEFAARVFNNEVFLCFSGVWTPKCITWSDNGLGDWLKETTFEPGNLRP